MRILLIRTSALGDVVHCLPVLASLRRHYPQARIGWVVEASMAPLLRGHPDLDEVLEVRLREWRRRPFTRTTIAELRTFLGHLRRFAPELVFDLMGNHKSGVLAALTLCDRRIGPAASDRREPSSRIWISEPVELTGEHVTDRALSLLDSIGIAAEVPDFGPAKLFANSEASAAAAPERYYVMHAGAAWANKRYPAALWGEVARGVRHRTGLPGLVVGGPGESALALSAVQASDGALAHFDTPRLEDLAALMRGADLVMGADTGPIHLARALDRPVLCLMGPTNPASHGPYGRPEASLWRQLPCSFCHRRFDEPKACLTTLAPELVAERAATLLAV